MDGYDKNGLTPFRAWCFKNWPYLISDDMTELDGKKVKWSDVDGKPTTFAPATHTHSYTDLENKPTIPTVPSKMTAAEATTGTATTARLIDAKTLNDVIDAKIAAANAGGGE